MQSPGFDPESERYMMDHMNADHADSNLMYVKVYGNLWSATAARMVTLDKTVWTSKSPSQTGPNAHASRLITVSKTRPMPSAPWWPCRGTRRWSLPRQASSTRRHPERTYAIARGQVHVPIRLQRRLGCNPRR